jgi:hypothetical protein
MEYEFSHIPIEAVLIQWLVVIPVDMEIENNILIATDIRYDAGEFPEHLDRYRVHVTHSDEERV